MDILIDVLIVGGVAVLVAGAALYAQLTNRMVGK